VEGIGEGMEWDVMLTCDRWEEYGDKPEKDIGRAHPEDFGYIYLSL
jgi:hypothetical protein